ncbi:nitrate reductase [Paralimibaculum aggregatum]|uniref:Nitrate reductase n=1 Tax=Paralimibaculum aggregatum TaxID=3036245 RepID=A0ABQ6LHG4_9RHOB|nr:nitrate reductase [Limibaculum sp. NKW23]GMG82437.1 nitrate reductase [Limibaculum sp. NKW23]
MSAGEPAATVCTTCPYCGVGCGVRAAPDGRGGAAISGDPEHPANRGRLCSKGSALGETLDLGDRLLAPRIGGRAAGWDEAIALTARRFSETIARHGPDSVAFYVSGQLLTEDYYVANKLMKGFIGSANIDTNSRLCMSSSVAGHNRAFGADTVPGTYEDLELAELVVLVGSNLAWCHPVLFQRLAAAKAANPALRVVTVDPRRTATSELADQMLPIAPGSDVALFNGLLHAIETGGALDRSYLAAHVSGAEAALEAARGYPGERVAALTGLAPAEIAAFYAGWIGAKRVVTVFSQGVNQSSSGTDKVNAIINCHLATGRIGRPGAGPFSVTGQPNAMGGREVGGLSNMLAAHLSLEDPGHRAAVQRFWRAPRMPERPGLKAVEMFRAVAEGRIRAIWIMATNPAVSMPEADAVRDAIAACPFVAVSDITAETDTAALADVLLPATGWGEKSGTVTNSERMISRQRAFLPAPGRARPDWRIICDLAAAMGWGDAFAYDGPAAIFREHAALSGVAAGLGRDFDISPLAGLSDAAYDALPPSRWPAGPEGGRTRFFAEGGFFTPDRRARMLPLTHRAPATATTPGYPLRLNTGRVRDHWHTMTRTAKAPRLSRHIAEPFAEIHPDDAAPLGIAPASLVTVESPHGRIVVRALVTDRTPPGSVFVPMHWTAQWSAAGRVGAAIPAATDPISGQPESKAAAVRLGRFAVGFYGFAVARTAFRPQTAFWARARVQGGWQAELADSAPPADWEGFARRLFGIAEGDATILTDAGTGAARLAISVDGAVVAALFTAPEPVAVSRSHLAEALRRAEGPAEMLAGRPGADRPDPGPTVCSCRDVGVNTILAAIARGGRASLDAVGAATGAGTCCGSCRPEIAALMSRASVALAAE